MINFDAAVLVMLGGLWAWGLFIHVRLGTILRAVEGKK
jgi:hypothetical protein